MGIRRATPGWSNCATSCTCLSSTSSKIEHFFTVYKDHDPDKAVEGDVSWVGRSDAEAEIERAHHRAGERTVLTEASDPLHGAGGQGGQR